MNNPLEAKDSLEVDILDQYVSDLMAIAQDINTPRESTVRVTQSLSSGELLSLLHNHKRHSTNEALKSSVQPLIDYIEVSGSQLLGDEADDDRAGHNLEVKKAPTEDDLDRGCFTDVSFAGTFATAQPEESIQGCFTEISFAGTFAQTSMESQHRLEDASAIVIKKVFWGEQMRHVLISRSRYFHTELCCLLLEADNATLNNVVKLPVTF